jgi:hypothetical protein
VMADTDAFYTPAPTTEYALRGRSGRGRAVADVPLGDRDAAPREQHGPLPYLPRQGESDRAHRAAVVVLPQWNSDAGGHVGPLQAADDERPDRACD